MKNIFILSLFASLFFMATTAKAQDYFKERRYEGMDFSLDTKVKLYRTIQNKKYEVVAKDEETLLGQKLSFDAKQKIFFIKRGKKTMDFKETIQFMRYVGNKRSAADLEQSLKYYYIGFGSKVGGFLVGTVGFFMSASQFSDSESFPVTGFIVMGTGALMYGGGYLFYKKGDNTVKKTLRYHNKNLGKFSQPVIASTNFMPSGMGFKPVRMNLLNPTPIPTLSLSWNF